MSEITDRPNTTSITAEIAPESPPFDAAEERPYRPLSLLALGGFCLAVVWIAIITLGGWIAIFVRFPIFFMLSVVMAPVLAGMVCPALGIFDLRRIRIIMGLALAATLIVLGFGGLLYYSGSDPWLLSVWGLLVPLVGLLLAAIGRAQIQRSEDTLSGLPLCNWAMGLIAAFGLMYGAYYGATFFAVRQQSMQFADAWLDKVQQGELDKAFRMTMPPEYQPPENAELRTKLETLFNSGPPGAVGKYGDFCMSDLVHMLQSKPKDANIERLGLLNWTYERGEYTTRYAYRVNSLEMTCDIDVVVRGLESNQGLYKGRQWFVDVRQTTRSQIVAPTMNDEAKRLASLQEPAREFIKKWIAKWYADDDDAYLWTLPPDKRAAVPKQGPDPGRDAYHDGAIVEVDPKIGWISQPFRDAFPMVLKKAFRPGAEKPSSCVLNPSANVPIIEATDTTKRFFYDVKITYREGHKDAKPAEVEAQIVLEIDNTSLQASQPDWQVKQLKVLRVHGPEATKMALPGPNKGF